MNQRELKRAVFLRFGGGVVVMGAVIFLLAGTLRYWEGWLFLAAFLVPMAVGLGFLMRRDPALLERRMQRREQRTPQRAIVAASGMFTMAGFLLPGLDHRYGWSTVPTWLVLAADALFLAGYLLFFLTLRENSYASRTIRVEEGQSVISTGPYAVVRHPMYLAILPMYICAPLALGSWWGVLPTLTTPFFLALRIQDEEKVLLEQLPGYREYRFVVKWRMIPGVW